MNVLFVLILMVLNGVHLPDYLTETNFNANTSNAEITNTKFARVFSSALSSGDGETELELLHEFDCSIPRWKSDLSISACEISKDIELILYEFKNYKGDYLVINHQNNGKFLKLPKKFNSPGSIEVLYKGSRNCISSVNQNSENAKDYLSVVEQLAGGLNDMPDEVPYRIYIINHHTSKPISIRYKLNGRNQSISTVEVDPDEKKYIIGYVLDRPRNLVILSAEFLNE